MLTRGQRHPLGAWWASLSDGRTISRKAAPASAVTLAHLVCVEMIAIVPSLPSPVLFRTLQIHKFLERGKLLYVPCTYGARMPFEIFSATDDRPFRHTKVQPKGSPSLGHDCMKQYVGSARQGQRGAEALTFALFDLRTGVSLARGEPSTRVACIACHRRYVIARLRHQTQRSDSKRHWLWRTGHLHAVLQDTPFPILKMD